MSQDQSQKLKPSSIGKVSVCRRHKAFVAECPSCNIEAGEKHTDHAIKRHVIVPVVRKTYINSNKYNSNGEVISSGLPEERTEKDG